MAAIITFGWLTTASGYNVVYWSDNGQDYWAVSDVSTNVLLDFAGLWKRR